MDYFYVIVASVALALLILILILLGISLKKQSKGKGGTSWPPIGATCPDYWKVDSSNPKYCMIQAIDQNNPTLLPRNTGTVYANNNLDPKFKTTTKGYDDGAVRINFSDPHYTACNTQKWAKTWGVYWDGYSNYNGVC